MITSLKGKIESNEKLLNDIMIFLECHNPIAYLAKM
jgi:hypothetical protein